MGLAPYAERFVSAGMAVLVFDYRHFGASDGQPRQLIDITRQLDDYRAAIRFARTLQGVDPERIALWGTSLSGGHVIAVAATDPQITAVVAQVPWVGIERGRQSTRSGRATLQLFAAAVRDVLGSWLGHPPFLIPAVGSPDELAVFTDADAQMWRETLAPTAPTWRNAFAARVLFSLLRYRPGRSAKQLTMPLLVCIGAQDTAASVNLAAQAATQAPRGELRRYPYGHFAAYIGAGFEQIVADQVAFLRRHLLAPIGECTLLAEGHPAS
jgi:alpha-beta hydrolase superfamily lysophospholipase